MTCKCVEQSLHFTTRPAVATGVSRGLSSEPEEGSGLGEGGKRGTNSFEVPGVGDPRAQ